MSVTSESTLMRGLALLSFVHRWRRVRFTDLREHLDLAATTVSRLVKDLEQGGWLQRSADGGYVLGTQMAVFQSQLSDREAMVAAAPGLLQGLRDRINQTTILFMTAHQRLRCMAKALHEDGLVMQHPGNEREDFYPYPWGWLLLPTLAAEVQQRMQQQADRMQREHMAAGLQQFHECGWTNFSQAGITKMAVPIYDRDGQIIAALGCGLVREQAHDIDFIGTAMRDCADHFQALVPKDSIL